MGVLRFVLFGIHVHTWGVDDTSTCLSFVLSYMRRFCGFVTCGCSSRISLRKSMRLTSAVSSRAWRRLSLSLQRAPRFSETASSN